MDDGDETGSSTRYTTGTSNEDGSSRNSSLDHFDVDPEMIKRRKNSESTEHVSSSVIGSFKIDSGVVARNRSPSKSQSDDDHHDASCEGKKARFPIIKMGSSSSESSTESDASSDFDLGTHDRVAKEGGPVVISPGTVCKGKPAAHLPGLPPTLQIMQRSQGYEPNRIPSSIFQRNTSDLHISDWSMASNESLFSIHVGNSHSFSREQAAMIISETRKGVPKSQQELFSFTPPRSEDEAPSSPTAFPPASPAVVEPREQNADKEGETCPESAKKPSDGHQSDSKKVPTVSWKSSAKYSEKSQNSSQSFAFPITKPSTTTVDDGDNDQNNDDDNGEQPIMSEEKRNHHCWQCSSCSCCDVSSCCSSPSCSCCSWPSCSCCSWPSCSCCSWPSCSCCSWPTCNCGKCSWPCSSCFSCKPCRRKNKCCKSLSSSFCNCCCSFRYCLRPSCCFCSDANCSFNCCSCSNKKSWCCLPTCSTCSSSDEAILEPDTKEGSHETAMQRKNTKRRWYSFLCCSWERLWCCSWPRCACLRCCC